MKRTLILFITVFTLAAAGAFAQERNPIEQARQNFAEANLQTKLEIMRNAENLDQQEVAPLYTDALQFALNNTDRIDANAQLQELTRIAVNGVERTEAEGVLTPLFRLFDAITNNSLKIEALNAIGSLGEGDQQSAAFLNDWVEGRNGLRRSGESVDTQVLRNAVITLGQIGHPSSFSTLLEVILLQYSGAITDDARGALFSLDADAETLIERALRDADSSDLSAALDFFLESDELEQAQKTRVAAIALDEALRARAQEPADQQELRQIRFRSVQVLENQGFGEATGTVIRHFNETVVEYDRGRITKDRLLEAIAALGAMETEAAAARLGDYLDLLNSYTENDRPVDTQIMLAVLRNIQSLGYSEPRNAVFYVTLLTYPDRVQEAAREALNAISD